MNKAAILTEISNVVLTGGRRTTAANVRQLLSDILDSYPNIVDGGQSFVAEVGYNSALTLTQNTSFTYKSWVNSAISTATTYSLTTGVLPKWTGSTFTDSHISEDSIETNLNKNLQLYGYFSQQSTASNGTVIIQAVTNRLTQTIYTMTDAGNIGYPLPGQTLTFGTNGFGPSTIIGGNNRNALLNYFDLIGCRLGGNLDGQSLYSILNLVNISCNNNIQYTAGVPGVGKTILDDGGGVGNMSWTTPPWLNLTTGGTLIGNLNGVTPTQITYLSGATSNIQNQINNLNSGMSWKLAIRVATTANITLSGTQTIDGIAVVVGDRVLVKDQSTASQNGIYIVSAGAWSRASDAVNGTSGSTGVLGCAMVIEDGTVNHDFIFICTTDAPITVGTTALTFAKSSATTYTASNGVTLSGNNFTLDNTYFTGNVLFSAGVSTIQPGVIVNSMITNSTIDVTTKITGIVPVANGGNGYASYTIGDTLYASASGAFTKVSAGATGTFLMYQGAGVLPVVSTLILPNASTTGRVVYSTGTNTYGESANLSFVSNVLNINALSSDGVSTLEVGGGSVHIGRADGNVLLNLTTGTGNGRYQVSTDGSANVRLRTQNSVNLQMGINSVDTMYLNSSNQVLISDSATTTFTYGNKVQIIGSGTQNSGITRYGLLIAKSSTGVSAGETSLNMQASYLHLGGQENVTNANYMISFGYNIIGTANPAASMGFQFVNDTGAIGAGDLIFNTRVTTGDTVPITRFRIAANGTSTFYNDVNIRITNNLQTSNYTLVLVDECRLVSMNLAGSNTLTVPTNASVAFPIGTQILLVQYGAGQTTVTAAGGVTINSAGSKIKLSVQFSGATLVKVGTDEWDLFGDLSA